LDELHITREMLRLMDDQHPLSGPVDAIQENIRAYKELFVGLPEIMLYESDEICWCINVLEVPENYVYKTRLTDENVDKRLDEILQQIGQHTTHIDWPVYRTCTPSNLGEKLVERGLTTSRLPWMLAELKDLPDVQSPDQAFHIEFVTDENMLAVWRDVSAAGFGMDSAQIFYDAYGRHGFNPDGDVLHYIGYLGSQPVTSSTILFAGGIAGLYDVSTPPEYRQRGFGTAITQASLKVAQERSYRYACVLASTMGRSIYQKLGCSVQVDIPEYRWNIGSHPV
jgi:ribosomal protein S18 acetylase RimI-like enzyme